MCEIRGKGTSVSSCKLRPLIEASLFGDPSFFIMITLLPRGSRGLIRPRRGEGRAEQINERGVTTHDQNRNDCCLSLSSSAIHNKEVVRPLLLSREGPRKGRPSELYLWHSSNHAIIGGSSVTCCPKNLCENGFAVTERREPIKVPAPRTSRGLLTVCVCIHMHVISENFTAIPRLLLTPFSPFPLSLSPCPTRLFCQPSAPSSLIVSETSG